MKAIEALLVFVSIFLVTISTADSAPYWRPQGRFGKRFSNTRNSDLMAALQTVSNENDNLEPLFMDGSEVTSNNDVMNDFYNNLPADLPSIPSKQLLVGGRICIETKVPGVFRCHRGRRSAETVLTLDEQ